MPHQLKAMGLSPTTTNDTEREKMNNKYSSQCQFLQHSGGTLASTFEAKGLSPATNTATGIRREKMSKKASGFSAAVGHLPHQLKAMGLSPSTTNENEGEKRKNKYSSQYQFLQHSAGILASSSVRQGFESSYQCRNWHQEKENVQKIGRVLTCLIISRQWVRAQALPMNSVILLCL